VRGVVWAGVVSGSVQKSALVGGKGSGPGAAGVLRRASDAGAGIALQQGLLRMHAASMHVLHRSNASMSNASISNASMSNASISNASISNASMSNASMHVLHRSNASGRHCLMAGDQTLLVLVA